MAEEGLAENSQKPPKDLILSMRYSKNVMRLMGSFPKIENSVQWLEFTQWTNKNPYPFNWSNLQNRLMISFKIRKYYNIDSLFNRKNILCIFLKVLNLRNKILKDNNKSK